MLKKITTILRMKDQMSPKIKKVSRHTRKLSKDVERARGRIVNFAVASSEKIENFAKKATISLAKVVVKTTALGLATAGALAGAGIKKGLAEAMDLEGYKSQIETATKDTKKAAEIMEWSIKLANKTPFEGGEVVAAAAKFEAMGMSAKKWVTITGDMAGATNKSLDQATEALIDAQTGELERLKEFGIKKADIVKKANEKFKNIQVVNAQGQVVDQKKFNEALVALLKDKFSGGMEKQAKTLRGTMSTVTGVMKSGLARIVGMQSSGTIQKGSLLDIIKGKAEQLAKKFVELEKSGAFDRIAIKVSEVVQKIAKVLTNLAKFVYQNRDIIIEPIKGVVNYLIANKDKILGAIRSVINYVKNNKDKIFNFGKITASIIGVIYATGKMIRVIRSVRNTINGVKIVLKTIKIAGKLGKIVTVIKKITTAIKAINIASKLVKVVAVIKKIAMAVKGVFLLVAANPVVLIIATIVAALAGIAYAVYKNWDKIKPIIVDLIVKFTTAIENIKAKFTLLWGKIIEGISNVKRFITEKVENMKAKFFEIKSAIVNFFKDLGESIKNAIKGVFEWIENKINAVKNTVSSIGEGISNAGNWVKDKATGLLNGITGQNANGTNYWRGGLTQINEHGKEVIDLPSGSRIYPATQSKNMNASTPININIQIQGNVIGNESYADFLSNKVATKILTAIGNT